MTWSSFLYRIRTLSRRLRSVRCQGLFSLLFLLVSVIPLNYWIYLGRGDLEKALDVAQNIGDTQLILHAYTNLYEKVKADTKMSGSDKQKKLNEYEKEISKLSKELGETSGSQSNGD